jgi:hypothetical protein
MVMTKNNQSTNLSVLLRKLDSLGSPVDLSVATEEEVEVEITQLGAPYDAGIMELEDGRAGCFFCVRIVNQTSRPIYSIETELRLPWLESYLDWLPDPRQRHREAHHYAFPGKGGFGFPRSQVLNHVLASEGGSILMPHVPYEGWLLAIRGLMPKGLRHGEQVDATLAITASDHSEYTAAIVLRVERCEVRSKDIRRRSTLYGASGPGIESVVGDRITPIRISYKADSAPDSESIVGDRQNRPPRA